MTSKIHSFYVLSMKLKLFMAFMPYYFRYACSLHPSRYLQKKIIHFATALTPREGRRGSKHIALFSDGLQTMAGLSDTPKKLSFLDLALFSWIFSEPPETMILRLIFVVISIWARPQHLRQRLHNWQFQQLQRLWAF